MVSLNSKYRKGMGAKLNRIKVVLVEKNVSQKELASMLTVPIDCNPILRL